MSAIIINEKNYKKEIERCKKPVLLSFLSDTGVSSLLLKQTADEISGEIKTGVVELNPTNAGLAEKYNIRFLPTTVLLKNSVVTDKIVGNMSREDFIKILKTP